MKQPLRVWPASEPWPSLTWQPPGPLRPANKANTSLSDFYQTVYIKLNKRHHKKNSGCNSIITSMIIFKQLYVCWLIQRFYLIPKNSIKSKRNASSELLKPSAAELHVLAFTLETNLELVCGFAHLFGAQMHHKHGEGVLGFLPHISTAILQTGVEMRDTMHQISRNRAHVGQPLSQPAQYLSQSKRYISSHNMSSFIT